MQSEPLGAAASPAPGEIAALLEWWKLAGVETPVNPSPQSWFAPAEQPRREAAPVASARALRQSVPTAPQPDPYAAIASLAELRALVDARAPFADGDPASGLMIMGEAPSPEDLRTGRPFTGPAGLFLDRLLASIGLDRSRCYISLLCPRRRVPGAPPPEAVSEELPLARAHIRLVAPRLLLLLGGTAAQALTGDQTPISRLRGRWLEVDVGAGPVPALATFNPAYLLRRPEDKALAWADLLAFRRRMLA
jgi:DNA polymerase